MEDFYCGMQNEDIVLRNLNSSQLRLLEKLSSAWNTTIPELFRLFSTAVSTDKNSSSTDNADCAQALLKLANEFYSNLTPDEETTEEVSSDNKVRAKPFIILGLVCCVLMIIVAVFGVIGNAISVWFFGKLSAKSSINIMLTAMAAFDCILLLTGAPLFSLVGIHSYTGNDYMIRSLSCCLIYLYTISTMSQTATTWMLVLITFERYIAICRPFLQRRICTLGRARKAVLVVSAFAVGYNVIRFWEFESDSKTGDARPLLREKPYYRSIYMHWMYLTLVFLLPFAIIAFFNAQIIRAIRASRIDRHAGRVHSAKGAHTPNRVQSEHRTAAMLLVVVVVFMVCEALAPVLNAMEMVGSNTGGPVFAFLSDLNNLLILLHSAMNVGIYVGFCSEFRRVCRLLLPLTKRFFCCSPVPLTQTAEELELSTAGSQRRRNNSILSANAFSINGNAELLRLTKTDSAMSRTRGSGTLKNYPPKLNDMNTFV